jgi:hypothetical protein
MVGRIPEKNRDENLKQTCRERDDRLGAADGKPSLVLDVGGGDAVRSIANVAQGWLIG